MSPSLPELIAITGREGSGKDSLGKYLAGLGYLHISAGDFLRDLARSRGHSGPISRTVLSQIGDELKQKLGPSPITESALQQYHDSPDAQGLAISGLRRTGELEAFKKHGGFILWIETTDSQRISNQESRGRGDHSDREELVGKSQEEYLGKTQGGHEGVNLQAVEAMADCRVANDGTLEDLYRNAVEALSQLER